MSNTYIRVADRHVHPHPHADCTGCQSPLFPGDQAFQDSEGDLYCHKGCKRDSTERALGAFANVLRIMF